MLLATNEEVFLAFPWRALKTLVGPPTAMKKCLLDDRVARKQVGGREQIEGKKSEVTEDE